MNDSFKRIHSASLEEALNGNRPKLSAQQFLGKNSGTNYFTTDAFLSYAQSLREQEVEQLERVFEAMQGGLRVVGSIVPRTDKGKRQYIFVTFVRPNAGVGYKFILEGGMSKLLQDYMDGKFVLGFTLSELVDEAMSSD